MSSTSIDERFQFACKLIEKAYKNNHRIYAHVNNENEAHMLDELLWTYKDNSFLPHNIVGEGPNQVPPIQIGFTTAPSKHHDLLLNLNNSVPDFYLQFARVLEIVINLPDVQEPARERFKFYKQHNHSLHTHKLESAEAQYNHG